jgi:hypothetical protein
MDEFNEIFAFDISASSGKGGVKISQLKTGIIPINSICWSS